MAAQTQRVASSELIPPPPAPHTPSVARIKNVQLSSSGTWYVSGSVMMMGGSCIDLSVQSPRDRDTARLPGCTRAAPRISFVCSTCETPPGPSSAVLR
jgi:hypothetical protein